MTKIDITNLSRDYNKNPVIKIGKSYNIPKEDIYELFINQDLKAQECSEYFGIKRVSFCSLLRKYRIGKYDYNDKKKINVSYEELYDYYIKQNHSSNDTCNHFNMSVYTLERLCRKYGIKKDTKMIYENCKKTNLNKYGVENQFQLDTIKEKSKQTTLQKYGKEHFVQTIDFIEKNYQTRISKYGEDDPYLREKFRQTCIEKHGVPNPDYAGFTSHQMNLVMDKDYLIEYIKENNIKNASELASKSGLKVNLANRISTYYDIRNLYNYTGSQYERELQDMVRHMKLDFIANYKIPTSKKEIDIYIPSKHIGIEFNGDYWHCEFARDEYYHQQKSMLANSQGIFIYHIYEHIWKKDKLKVVKEISELLGLKREHFGEYEVKEIRKDVAKQFVEENSFYKFDKDANKFYGIYSNNELLHIQTYYCLDNRVCICNDVNKLNEDYVNASLILLNYFKKNNNYNEIYCYTNIGYKNELYPYLLGFELSTICEPDYKWYKSGAIEEKILNESDKNRYDNDWFKLYDCGKKCFKLLLDKNE